MNNQELITHVSERFPDAILGSHDYRGDATVVIRRESLVEIARDAGLGDDAFDPDCGESELVEEGPAASRIRSRAPPGLRRPRSSSD